MDSTSLLACSQKAYSDHSSWVDEVVENSPSTFQSFWFLAMYFIMLLQLRKTFTKEYRHRALLLASRTDLSFCNCSRSDAKSSPLAPWDPLDSRAAD